MFESCRGHSLLMQVSGGFLVPVDWSWLAVVGALVGDWCGMRWRTVAGDGQSGRGMADSRRPNAYVAALFTTSRPGRIGPGLMSNRSRYLPDRRVGHL